MQTTFLISLSTQMASSASALLNPRKGSPPYPFHYTFVGLLLGSGHDAFKVTVDCIKEKTHQNGRCSAWVSRHLQGLNIQHPSCLVSPHHISQEKQAEMEDRVGLYGPVLEAVCTVPTYILLAGAQSLQLQFSALQMKLGNASMKRRSVKGLLASF